MHPERTGGSSCGPRSAFGAAPLVTRRHLFVSALVRPTEKQKPAPRGSGGSKRCEQEATLGIEGQDAGAARSSPVAGTTARGAGSQVLGWGRLGRSRESLSTKHHGPGYPGRRLSAHPSAHRPASVGPAAWPWPADRGIQSSDGKAVVPAPVGGIVLVRGDAGLFHRFLQMTSSRWPEPLQTDYLSTFSRRLGRGPRTASAVKPSSFLSSFPATARCPAWDPGFLVSCLEGGTPASGQRPEWSPPPGDPGLERRPRKHGLGCRSFKMRLEAGIPVSKILNSAPSVVTLRSRPSVTLQPLPQGTQQTRPLGHARAGLLSSAAWPGGNVDPASPGAGAARPRSRRRASQVSVAHHSRPPPAGRPAVGVCDVPMLALQLWVHRQPDTAWQPREVTVRGAKGAAQWRS